MPVLFRAWSAHEALFAYKIELVKPLKLRHTFLFLVKRQASLLAWLQLPGTTALLIPQNIATQARAKEGLATVAELLLHALPIGLVLGSNGLGPGRFTEQSSDFAGPLCRHLLVKPLQEPLMPKTGVRYPCATGLAGGPILADPVVVNADHVVPRAPASGARRRRA